MGPEIFLLILISVYFACYFIFSYVLLAFSGIERQRSRKILTFSFVIGLLQIIPPLLFKFVLDDVGVAAGVILALVASYKYVSNVLNLGWFKNIVVVLLLPILSSFLTAICVVFVFAWYGLFDSGLADLDAIKKRYDSKPAVFEELTQMAAQDLNPQKRCLGVGTDNIALYYEYGDKWTHSNSTKRLDLKTVLDDVGISGDRYSNYLELLEDVGSERITYCSNGSYHFLMHRSGLAVSGCVVDIVHHTVPPNTYGNKDDGGDFQEAIQLSPTWWMTYSCT